MEIAYARTQHWNSISITRNVYTLRRTLKTDDFDSGLSSARDITGDADFGSPSIRRQVAHQ